MWGWPGSLLVVDGGDFGPELDDNRVFVGGDEALVVRAAPTRLTVLVGSGAGSGPIEVHRGGVVVAAPSGFEVLPFPDEWSVAAAGPPEFFHGPQHGTPQLERTGQPVVALMTHAHDTPRPTTADLTAERISFDEAVRFWREASFGKTTFTLTTDWLQLPRNRNEYVSDQRDIGWARSSLLSTTKLWTQVVGNRAYVVHHGGLSIVDLTNRNQPTELGRILPGSPAYHVVVRGTLAYVAVGNNGLVIVDVANPGAPFVRDQWYALGKVRAVDIDPTGTIFVAAALEDGLHVFDLTNPLMPVLKATVAVGDEWATSVKLVGSRAFVGTGTRVRVYDLATLAAPNLLDAKDAGRWVMGLDADTGACAAATDGNGLALFTVAANGKLAPAGTARDVLRLHGVRLLGRTACCAGADKGVHLVDISTPAAPAALATVATARPCYDVAPDGPWALLGLGAWAVVPIGLADQRAPQLGAEVHLSADWPFSIDVDPLAALRTNLANVTNNHGKLKTERLFVDALRAAASLGVDLTGPVGVVIVIAGEPGCGSSRPTTKVGVPGDEWTFPDTKGVIWLAGGAHWGRKAHEIGHWFKMPDLYADWTDDGRFLPGTAAPWCMAGNHDRGPLFSAREAIRMKLFKPENIEYRKWNPGGGPTVETFDIVAHDLGEDASVRAHLLQLEVAAGLSYFVEVRQKPGAIIFDKILPATKVDDGLVVVTRCEEGQSISNTFERPTMLFGIVGVGESVVDAARQLRIEVEAQLASRPLAFRVKVHWNEEPPPDPNGKFDLRISPWNTDTWESPDIWVNSPRNDHVPGTPRYFFHEPPEDETWSHPILNGDKPWVQHPNTLFARVRNTGVQAVSDVYVTAYTTTPPGIGDNGNWRTLETKQVANIAANGEAIVEFSWSPAGGRHTCLSVAVMPKAGEIEPRNNRAQENVAQFDCPGSSSHEPAILDAEVRSPFSEWRKVDLEVRGLPDGWHAVVDRAWVWVPPKGAVPVTAVIWTDVDSPRDERRGLPREAFPALEGWTDFDHRYLPIGGILAPVRANRRTRIKTESSGNDGVITVYGWLDPKIAGVPATLEVTDPVGAVKLWPMGDTNDEGRVVIKVPADPGSYQVQVFTGSTPEAAEAESESWTIDVE